MSHRKEKNNMSRASTQRDSKGGVSGNSRKKTLLYASNSQPAAFERKQHISPPPPSSVSSTSILTKNKKKSRTLISDQVGNLFKALSAALSEDKQLNVHVWGKGDPVVAPPFPGGSDISVLHSRSSLSRACTYFSDAVTTRSEAAAAAGILEFSKGEDDVERWITAKANTRLKLLENRHKQYTNRLKARKASVQELDALFNDRIISALDSLMIKDQLYRRKLRLQAEIANRRLQELLFECLGEISKACRRASLLGKKLCENVDAEKAHSTMSTQWEEFCMKLNEDTFESATAFVPVEKYKFPKEFKAWEDECEDVISASKLIDPAKQSTTVIRMRRVLYLHGKRPKHLKDQRRRVTKLYQSRGGVRGLVSQLMNEYGLKKKDAQENGALPQLEGGKEESVRMPLYSAPMPISSKSISWLLSPGVSYPNSSVYYCIEERLLKQYDLHANSADVGSKLKMQEKGTNHAHGGEKHGVSPAILARVASSIARFLASTYVPGAREDPEAVQGGDNGSGFHTAWKPQEWLRRVLQQLSLQGVSLQSKVAGSRRKWKGKSIEIVVAEADGEHRRQSHISALDSVPSSAFIGSSLQSGSTSYEEAILTQQLMNSFPDVLCAEFSDVTIDAIGEPGGDENDDDQLERSKSRFAAKKKAKAVHRIHFAPVSVMHILETIIFGDVIKVVTPHHRAQLFSHYPEELLVKNSISNLYVLQESPNQVLPRTDSAARDRGSPLKGSFLVPLSRPAMQELVGIYAVRRLDQGTVISPDAVSIYREEGTESVDYDTLKLHYFILHRPLTRGSSADARTKIKDSDYISQYSGMVESARHKAALKMNDGRHGRLSGNTLAQEKARIQKEEEKQRLAEERAQPVPLASLVGLEIIDTESAEISQSVEGYGPKVQSVFAPEIESVSGTSVGGFCRWRGCICPGQKHGAKEGGKSKFVLCSMHQNIRLFLEGSGAKDELARHLPSQKKSKTVLKSRKGSHVAAEFVKITANSALLQELSGGKLAATIRAFCRRAAADAKNRKQEKGNKSDKGGNDVGAETVQQLARTETKRKELLRDVAMSQKVYSSEKNVAEELRKICALGVFPAEELGAIRDEYNVLNRERVALQQRKAIRGAPAVRATATYNVDEGEEEGSDPASEEISTRHSGPRTEGELELEFCKRKNAILVARRSQLEHALAAGKIAARETFSQESKDLKAVLFDANGYPIPIANTDGSKTKPSGNSLDKSKSAPTGHGSKSRNRAEARLQDARNFSKTYGSGPYGSSRSQKTFTSRRKSGP